MTENSNENEVAKSSTPRPTFDEPTHIRHQDVTLHLWGDEGSGEVVDWVYVSSDKIHHLVFGLAPGQSFGHSDRHRTIFAADEFLYVLSGTLVIINPEIGEVHKVETGEGVFFRRDTWHHAVSFGEQALRVVEFFAPPPSTGASSAYARTQDLLTDVRYGDNRWLGTWPMSSVEREQEQTIHVLKDANVLWRLDGDALCGIYVSTEHLTAGRSILRPGGGTSTHVDAGDATIQVLSGTLNVLLPDAPEGTRRLFELQPEDGFSVPEGNAYQVRNATGQAAEFLFAVAPKFL
jgi:quercetin dioxygenase-like cupin family protein